MKSLFLVITCLFVLSTAFGEVSIEHQVGSFSEGQQIVVRVVVETDREVPAFDLSEFVPADWKIESWKADRYESNIVFESTEQEYGGKTYNMNHWKLNGPVSESFALEFTFSEKPKGEYDLFSIWMYPTSFGKEDYTIQVNAEKSKSSITGFAVDVPQKRSTSISVSSVINALDSLRLY